MLTCRRLVLRSFHNPAMMRDTQPLVPALQDVTPQRVLSGEQPFVSPRERRYNLTPRPLQFASLQHFEDRYTELRRHALAVEGLSPKTVAWMQNAYASWWRLLRSTPARERAFLAGDAVEQQRLANDWIAWLRESGVSRTTIATYWHGLDAILRRLETQDGTFNPLAYLPRPKAASPLPRCLTRSVAEDLLQRVRHYPWRSSFEMHRNLAVVGLMLMAGLRRGEVIRLGYGDADLANRTLRIVRGKGRHGGKDRTAYMTPQLMMILADYMDARRKVVRTHPEFVSSTRRNGGIAEVTIRRLFSVMSRAMDMRISPHMLRHTYATLLRQSGVADRVAQELLGHSSLAMLQRYSHIFEGECVAEAARLRFEA